MAAWVIPIAFVSWFLFGAFGAFGIDHLVGKILLLKFIGFTLEIKILLAFEVVLLAFGLFLLIYGLIQIIKSRVRKEGLVTNGLYKYIRHPQHLGIIIMAFAFSLYVPGTKDLGIRIADILSWSLFSLILFFWSDYEDKRLAIKFTEQFHEYYSKTGAYFPKLFNKNTELKIFPEIKSKKRYLFTILAYLLFVVIVLILTYILSLPGIEILVDYN